MNSSVVVFLLVIIIGYILPFIINIKLAKSRGKSTALMVVLTVVFSWLVTLILAFMPEKNECKTT